jgi:hypothetical protein
MPSKPSNKSFLLYLLSIVSNSGQQIEIGLGGLLICSFLHCDVKTSGREGDLQEVLHYAAIFKQKYELAPRMLDFKDKLDVLASEQQQVVERGLADGGMRHAV